MWERVLRVLVLLTMVSCVGAADSGGVDTSLTGSLEAVCADSDICDPVNIKAREGLEVKPKMLDFLILDY